MNKATAIDLVERARALAPLIRLGYLRMTWMALPYFLVMTTTGLAALAWLK